MAKLGKNESKTEEIVRDHFRKYTDVIIEEKKSDNPKIAKLLSTASKSGMGSGYPEFIIQYKNNPDFLIVIECKPDITKHESKDRNRPKDYAVDGTLLYSSYLSRDFDVLSIGVSGENQRELKVSHFLQLKGGKRAIEKFSSKLLPVGDYLSGYIKSPEKFRQDYDKLLLFSKDLNEKLHGYKILESDRALLVGCILIALENPAFLKAYKEYTNAEDLASFLVGTAVLQFKNSGIQKEKIRIIESNLDFIRIGNSLSERAGILRDIITDINNNVNSFIRTHKFFDVLGQLYIEFLRYANSDKGLGIVLTPPHITKFMAELAEVNKSSVVYDNCAGTGGFLISAMELMIKDAKDDQEKIKNIKQYQIVGTESQPKIFTLACSNMFIHQDGKTNILKGDCFDKEIVNKVKSYNPTVGLLNPPYKANKKEDTEELEFILNNLECIEQGGKCAAIVPMQAALAQSGRILELKRKILAEHTLEAVFSMPNELFVNSKVGEVTCIMLFTAKRPHPKNKKVFLGYFKDDGYEKIKNRGRIDVKDKWKEIRQTWINTYLNREDIFNLSINKVIKPEDEWCVEAFMEVSYESLTEDKFNEVIKKFIAFNIISRNYLRVGRVQLSDKKLKLNVENWQKFPLNKVFEHISLGKPIHKRQIDEERNGGFAYVTRTTENNGIELFIDNVGNYPVNKPNCIIIGAEGFEAFYQVDNFITGNKINILRDRNLNLYNALFLKPILDLEVGKKFNYGRGATKERLSILEIKLPSKGGKPNWEFMEKYIKSLPYSVNL
jgi:type I restriction enzyme M protein